MLRAELPKIDNDDMSRYLCMAYCIEVVREYKCNGLKEAEKVYKVVNKLALKIINGDPYLKKIHDEEKEKI